MHIAIKSEMDSRPLLYPLMRALRSFGSILVLSNNTLLRRLIEEQDTFSFRNITVLVDNSDSADEICENYGISSTDYDFIIVDNLGSSECDVCFIAVGASMSEEFDAEMQLLMEDEHLPVYVLQFGKAAVKQPEKETPEERKERLEREKQERLERKNAAKKPKKSGEVPEGYDPAGKFRVTPEDKSIRKQKATVIPFPNFQEIETVEAEHKFAEITPALANVFFTAFESELAINKLQFDKEVRKKDESSGYVSTRPSVW